MKANPEKLLHPILLAFQSYYALFVSTLNHGYSQFLLKAWKLYANHQLKDHLVTYLKLAWANRTMFNSHKLPTL